MSPICAKPETTTQQRGKSDTLKLGRKLLYSAAFFVALSTAQSAQAQSLSTCNNPAPGFLNFNFSNLVNDTGSGVGRTWTYLDVADHLGESVNINAEIVAMVGGTDFDSLSSSSSSTNAVLTSITSGTNAATIQWSFVRASDGSPIAVSAEMEYGDLDLRTGRQEYIEIEQATYDGYNVPPGSLVTPSTDGTTDRFDGQIDDNGLPEQAIQFTIIDRTTFTWTQGMDHLGSGSSGRAGFTVSAPKDIDGCPRYDFSDSSGHSEAQHNAFSELSLGSTIDSEASAATDSGATADGADEDGIGSFPTLNQGSPATLDISVTEPSAGTGYLQTWIDFNGDGSFGGSEQIALDMQDSDGNGTISLNFNIPSNAVTTQTIARLRWSTETGLNSTSDAPNGEVEDYALIIEPAIEADLVTVKTLTSGNANPDEGETVTFEIEVTNNGGDAATGVKLTDLIPAGLTATSNNGTVTAGTYDAGTGLWTIGDLANGESATLTIEGTIDAGQGGNTIENITTAAIGNETDPTDNGNDLTESIVVESVASGPAFPPGGGLSNSVCGASPATSPWQDIGLRWTHNDNGGTSPNAGIDQTSFFASASPASFSGINGQVNSFDLNLNADQIPANYDPNIYFEYEFTTQNFTKTAELTGFGATVFEATQAWHVQDTGAYHIAVAIDDDPSFASPDILISDVAFDGVDVGTASASTGTSDTGQYIQNFAHWDANGDIVSLQANTSYKMRVYPYGVTRFGKDNGQPYSNVVIFDDYMPKLISCDGPSADLVTIKTLTSGDATPAESDTVTFEIEVTNNAGDDATGVSLTDLIPSGLTATTNNGTVTAGTYDATNGLWTIGDLANGVSVTLTIEGTVDAGQAGNTIENITTVATGDQTDPTDNGNDLTESVMVAEPQPSLAMTKIADSEGPHNVGDVVTYTYTVTNDGDTNVRDIAINDTHNGSDPAPTPGNETLLADNGTEGDSTDSTVDGNWDVLAPGDVVIFTGTYTITQMDVENL